MANNQKRETAHHSAAIDPAQLSPYGGGVNADLGADHANSEALPPAPPRGPPDRMMRLPEVIACTGLSRTTLWKRMRAGTFPAATSLGENSIGWPEHVITEWLSSRPVVSYAPGPEASAT